MRLKREGVSLFLLSILSSGRKTPGEKLRSYKPRKATTSAVNHDVNVCITSNHDTKMFTFYSKNQDSETSTGWWVPATVVFFGTIFRGGFIHIRCCGESLSVCVVVAMKEHVRPAAALWCALIVCVVIISDVQLPPTLHADVMNPEPQKHFQHLLWSRQKASQGGCWIFRSAFSDEVNPGKTHFPFIQFLNTN